MILCMAMIHYYVWLSQYFILELLYMGVIWYVINVCSIALTVMGVEHHSDQNIDISHCHSKLVCIFTISCFLSGEFEVQHSFPQHFHGNGSSVYFLFQHIDCELCITLAMTKTSHNHSSAASLWWIFCRKLNHIIMESHSVYWNYTLSHMAVLHCYVWNSSITSMTAIHTIYVVVWYQMWQAVSACYHSHPLHLKIATHPMVGGLFHYHMGCLILRSHSLDCMRSVVRVGYNHSKI